MNCYLTRYIFLSFLLIGLANAVKIPDVTIKAFFPNGLQASIPANSGISLFAFHGNVNQPIPSHDAGEMSGDVRNIQNGKFTFTDNYVELNMGDTIYYWITIEHGGRHHHAIGSHVVDHYIDKPGNHERPSPLIRWFPRDNTEQWESKCVNYCQKRADNQNLLSPFTRPQPRTNSLYDN